MISSNLIAGTMLNDAAENRKATTDHTPDEANHIYQVKDFLRNLL